MRTPSLTFTGLAATFTAVQAFLSEPSASCRPASVPLFLSDSAHAVSSFEKVKEGDLEENNWMKHGLLLSSFSDGLVPNPQARTVLQQGLVRTLLVEEQRRTEETIEATVKNSPCCGPTDPLALDRLEKVDRAIESLSDDHHSIQKSLDLLVMDGLLQSSPSLRVVYIPTALYALRPDSENTPGKQRQRARADGKKRRNLLVDLLQELVSPVPIEIVTLDFDDGSVKQPQGEDASILPRTGKEALGDWRPHLVYVQGGNTFWLHHCMDKGGWDSDLIRLCRDEQTFFIGSSAGAILAGNMVQTATWKGWDDPRVVPGMEDYQDWVDVPGLGLVGNKAFFPHMDDTWNDLVKEKSALLENTSVCALRDNEACYVDGNTKTAAVFVGPIS